MNWLTIVVLVLVGYNVFIGYRKGFLRVVYSILGWVLVFAFVAVATPYVEDFLIENTNWQTQITRHCESYLEKKAQEKIEQKAKEQEEETESSVLVPEDIFSVLGQDGTELMNEAMKQSGVYHQVAVKMAQYVIRAIAFLMVLLAASIIQHWVYRMLKTVDKIPILKDANRILGMFVGAFKGLILIWIVFYLVDIFGMKDMKDMFHQQIEESRILIYIYDNNMVENIILQIQKFF